MAVTTVVRCDSKGKTISSTHYKNGTPISDEEFIEIARRGLSNSTVRGLLRDAFHSIAKRIWETGKEETRNFVLDNFPDSKLVKNEYENMTFRRIIKSSSGERIVVVYDYTTQSTTTYLEECEVNRSNGGRA